MRLKMAVGEEFEQKRYLNRGEKPLSNLEEYCQNSSAIFSLFLVDDGEEHVLGFDAVVGHPAVVLDHPDEHVRQSMLRFVGQHAKFRQDPVDRLQLLAQVRLGDGELDRASQGFYLILEMIYAR